MYHYSIVEPQCIGVGYNKIEGIASLSELKDFLPASVFAIISLIDECEHESMISVTVGFTVYTIRKK